MPGERIIKFHESRGARSTIAEYIIAVVLTGCVTALSLAIEPVVGHAAVSSLYLLLVVVAGFRFKRESVLFVAASSTLAWYTVFIPPRFSFHIGTVEDALIFASFFAVAVAMGHLTSRLHLKEVAERMRERRTAALYELVQQAGLAADLDSGLTAAVKLTETFFGVRAALLLLRSEENLAVDAHPASSFELSENDSAAAGWAFAMRRAAGKFTENHPNASALHLPLLTGSAAMGVLSVLPAAGAAFDRSERDLLEAFAVLIGTILERDRLHQDLKQAEIIKVSERLQRALLQSFSHELKTPLSAVQAGIEAFHREAGGPRSQAAWSESQKALRRLRRVINNLLDMTRIESGVIHPNLDWCDVGELIQAATDLAADGIGETPVAIELGANVPLIRVDQPLLEQCLCNLLLNASASSAAGAKVVIRARVADGQLFLSVLDEGSGISEADLPRIFGAFQRGAAATPGGTGLGLAIVEGFVLAHGGSVSAGNRPSGGAEFTMKIPVETLRPEVLERLP